MKVYAVQQRNYGSENEVFNDLMAIYATKEAMLKEYKDIKHYDEEYYSYDVFFYNEVEVMK